MLKQPLWREWCVERWERGTNVLPRIIWKLEKMTKVWQGKGERDYVYCSYMRWNSHHLWATWIYIIIYLFPSFIHFLAAVLRSLELYPPWCRHEQPSAGHCSPGRRRRSGYPDSWRGGAASWGTNSRPEPQMTTGVGRRQTAETRWCPPSTRDGLERGGGGERMAICCLLYVSEIFLYNWDQNESTESV